MAIPSSKDELLDAITITFAKLMIDLERVPESRARDLEMDGHKKGTRMSPADLVAYLVGWNNLVLKWLRLDDAGKDVDFPETDFKWNELGLLAQKFYSDYETESWPTLLVQLRSANDALVETIEARSDDELYGVSWFEKYTKGRMIQLNTSSPYKNARSRVRKWLRALDE